MQVGTLPEGDGLLNDLSFGTEYARSDNWSVPRPLGRSVAYCKLFHSFLLFHLQNARDRGIQDASVKHHIGASSLELLFLEVHKFES